LGTLKNIINPKMITVLIELILFAVVIIATIVLTIIFISMAKNNFWNCKWVWVMFWALGLGYFAFYWMFDKKFFNGIVHTALVSGTGFWKGLSLAFKRSPKRVYVALAGPPPRKV
jgi:hypothetical protein